MMEGNLGRRPIIDDEIIVDLPPRKPPVVAANALASEEWDRILGVMPPGLISAAHESVLSMHALAWSNFCRAHGEIAEHGLTVTTPKGRTTNPAVKVWKMSADTLHRTAALLGLHPGARIGLPKRSETPFGGKFEGLLGHKKN
jgi:P27 family predicted phage terminase small subunit